MVVRPESDLHDIVNLDGGYNYDRKLNNLSSLRRNVIPYPVSSCLVILGKFNLEFFLKFMRTEIWGMK